jgi:exodeoxyribonuclease VII small subunit
MRPAARYKKKTDGVWRGQPVGERGIVPGAARHGGFYITFCVGCPVFFRDFYPGDMLSGGHQPKIGVCLFRTSMPKASASSPVASVPPSYEAALEELEQLVARLESGTMPLEQLLNGYQRGADLLKFCRAKLEAVENQIKVLDEGTLKPWTAE